MRISRKEIMRQMVSKWIESIEEDTKELKSILSETKKLLKESKLSPDRHDLHVRAYRKLQNKLKK